MRKAGGWIVQSGNGLSDLEHDTFTCSHCNGVVVVPPNTNPEHICICCMKHLCAPCNKRAMTEMKCVPFEKRMEAMERRERFRRAI